MVPMRDLRDDYYEFDNKYMSIRSRKTHKKYTLGDKLNFKVKDVDRNKKTIDYEIYQQELKAIHLQEAVNFSFGVLFL